MSQNLTVPDWVALTTQHTGGDRDPGTKQGKVEVCGAYLGLCSLAVL